MQDSNSATHDVAVPFDVKDLIFSTTDKKGVIRSVNDIFLKMARYSMEEVLGKPHKLVRHPSMPRAGFQLYWDYIQRGEAVGVFVTNRASDGAFYKVYTLATPLDDGYLAIRFKTTSALQDVVDGVYKKLCEYEAEEAAKGIPSAEYMNGSRSLLMDELRQLGFESYEEFMIATLVQEMRSRDNEMREVAIQTFSETRTQVSTSGASSTDAKLENMIGYLGKAYQVSSRLFDGIGTLLDLQKKLQANASAVTRVSKLFEMSSINVSLEATRTGDQARCLSVIATHLSESSQTVRELADSMRSQIEISSGSLGDLVFRTAAARLQVETMLDFCQKAASGIRLDAGDSAELVLTHPRQRMDLTIVDLLEAIDRQRSTLGPTMQELIKNLRKLEADLASVKRSMLSLRFAQLGGKIESSRLGQDSVIGTLVESIGTEIIRTVGQISDLESDLNVAATGVEMSFRLLGEMNVSLSNVRGCSEVLNDDSSVTQAAA
ncbi:MAG: hypothetical protein Phyf2KO_10730 [Phycisphaerales bacterium]